MIAASNWLNLDYFSITRLSTFVISICIAIYLLRVHAKSPTAKFLSAAFWGGALFHFAMLIEFAGEHYWQPYNFKNIVMPIAQYVGPAIACLALLRFTHGFPAEIHKFGRTLRAIFTAAVVLDGLGLGFCIACFALFVRLPEGERLKSIYFTAISLLFALQFLLVAVILFAKSVYFGSWKALRIGGKLVGTELNTNASAAKAMAIVLLLPLAIVGVFALAITEKLSPVAATYVVWVAFISFYSIFVIAYLNLSKEPITLQVKLVALGLIAASFVVSLQGTVVGIASSREYRNANMLEPNTSIRFDLGDTFGYDIYDVPFQFEHDLGSKIPIDYGESETVELDFAFPFFESRYRTMTVQSGPAISLGDNPIASGWGGYHPVPMIAPVIMNLDPSRGGGVFYYTDREKAVVTWYRLPERGLANSNTVQLQIYRTGTIVMSFERFIPQEAYSPDSVKMSVLSSARVVGIRVGDDYLPFAPRLTGLHPGSSEAHLREVSFIYDLPVSIPANTVVYEAFDAEYRRYLHRHMFPAALILIASCFFMAFVFPEMFRKSFLRPLEILLHGVKEADRGNLDISIEPKYRDEIGQITDSFNRMLISIRESHESLRRQQERLLQADKLAALGVLVASVAHEVNNPNQAIMSTAAVLRRTTNDVASIVEQYCGEPSNCEIAGMDTKDFLVHQGQMVDRISSCARKIQEIVLGLKNSVTEETPVNPAANDVNNIVESAVTMITGYICGFTDEFHLELDRNLPKPVVIADSLAQAVVNLIQNACLALEDRTKRIVLKTYYDAGCERVAIQISDEGTGIEPDVLPRIRDPFFSTRREAGGMGLGLAITQGIIDRHGGNLVFESSPGRGTKATILLPTETSV